MPIMGSWSAMRKYLESEMICNSLKGRIRYHLTSYPNMDHCGHFEVFVDGESRKIFSLEYAASRINKEINSPEGFWETFWKVRNDAITHQNFDDMHFANALKEYRENSIEDSITSENSIVRMFAILDRRVGKRTLSKIKNTVSAQPEWLSFFYNLRLTAEGL